jgi:putative SbcD/Mre11-related phosphoesterase
MIARGKKSALRAKSRPLPGASQKRRNTGAFSAFEISVGITADARRALWLTETQTLAVADLHLGYAWAHRHSGNLLPLSAREDSVERLLELVESHQPRELALLGDIVHRAVPVKALKSELCELIEALGARTRLRLIAGNHDRDLRRLLDECGIAAELVTEFEAGKHLLTHGDGVADSRTAASQLQVARARGGRVIIGHEHPAITISDGAATSVKCPCFLVSERLIVLPAFSNWAAGANVRSRRFMSAFARGETFDAAFAVLAGKILPVRL